MDLTGQESQGGPGHPAGRDEAGPEEAPEPGPRDSGRPSGAEGGGTPPGGAAGGGPAAGPAAGRREGRGETDGAAGKAKPRGSERGKEVGEPEDQASQPGGQRPVTSRAKSWERSRGRLPERELGEGKDPLEEKPGGRKTARPVETQENERFGEKEASAGRDAEQQVRRATIRFSVCPRSSAQPPWSRLGCPSPSVYNQLAKMGDPDVLEMVQQEGGSRRRGARGGLDTARGHPPHPHPTAGRGTPGTLAALQPGARGRSQSGVPRARPGLQGEQILPGVGG